MNLIKLQIKSQMKYSGIGQVIWNPQEKINT